MNAQELFQQLKVDYLETGHHHCRSGWIQLKECPYCKSDNYHLGFHLEGRFFSCWRCGGHQSVQTLAILGLSKQDAWDFVRESLGARIDAQPRKGLKEPSGRQKLAAIHREYLEERGFEPEEIERHWQIEAFKHHPRLGWRIYIPVIQEGKRVSWTTRAIGNVPQRYVSARADEEAVSIKHCVYGLDYCLHSVVVVEGPTDAWKVGPGAAALLGTAFTPAQVLKLSRIPFRVVCFDSSLEAQAKARDLCRQLSAFPGETRSVEIDAP